ncbi:hypothetical protein ACH5RR_006561 [Cinchona calisaya]|uniref:RING-type E3 ubiquitin transferase n=1 Tax=Cinchona calisaya TaxID=153742 RepID=A0ABD3APC8_9GENT
MISVRVQEIFHCRKVRLFRWNEKILRNNKVSDSEGLALFRITSSFKTFGKPSLAWRHEIESVTNERGVIVPFNLSDLLGNDKKLGPRLVRETKRFRPETYDNHGHHISDYLFSRFQFDPETINLQQNSAKIVIVIEVFRVLLVFFDNAQDPNFRISFFMPPERTLEKVDKDEDNHARDDKEDKDDFLLQLRTYLNISGSRGMGRPLTKDEPRAFVEISPKALGKRKEFDKKVETCPICLGGFDDVDDKRIFATTCYHVFHRDCISKWLLNKNSCPTCRLVLPFSD